MLKVRGSLVSVVQIGSGRASAVYRGDAARQFVSTVGLFLFSGTLVFSLVTLPVEYNASARAVAMLESAG